MPWWQILAVIVAGIVIVCLCSFVYGFVVRLREIRRPGKILDAQAQLRSAIDRGDQAAEAAWAKRVTQLLARRPPACRVYWGHAGCALPRGHRGDHTDEHGRQPDPGFMFGEETTPAERAEMD